MSNYKSYFSFRRFHFVTLLLLCLFVLLSLNGCEEEPSELGLNYIPPGDTFRTKTLDSQTDTILITESNTRKYINTSASANLLVGLFQQYISKALLKFKDITQDYDSATVLSATLNLKYNNYYFEDSLGVTSFNVYSLINSFDFSEIEYDELTSANIGSTVLGSYNGTLTDSAEISINLNNQTVQDWLNYAADTNYPVKNYGIVMLANSSTNTIKSFFASNTDESIRPSVTVIVSKNSVVDTLNLNISESVSLNTVPVSIIPAERFVLQSGVSFRNIMKFDLAKLPPNVIINLATLEFTVDKNNSFISSNSDPRVNLGMLTDLVNQETDGLIFQAYRKDSITYTVILNSIFQQWNLGTAQNYGLLFWNVSEVSNLDRFVFYDHTSSDINRRPRLKIIYTLRN